ncbi:MAG: hypothetical protein FWH15_08280 [Betaproteobacteria bacterium]|nr:hypothetical protein [Betaproteobacteria bacterium]
MKNSLKRFFPAVFALFGAVAAFALPLSLDLDIAHIQHPAFSISGLTLNVRSEGGALNLARLDIAGQSWQQARIECGKLSLASGAFHCGAGRLHIANQAPIALDIRQQNKQWTLRLTHAANEYTQAVYDGESQNLHIEFVGTNIKDLSAFLPTGWHSAGKLEGMVNYDGKRLSAALTVRDGAYASPDGSSAAEKMAATFSVSGEENKGKWKMKGRLEWLEGDWFHAPVFLTGNGQNLEFAGEIDASGWALSDARFTFPEVGQIAASGHGLWAEADAMNLKLSAKSLALQSFGEAIVAPILASQGTLRADLSGKLNLDAEWKNGEIAVISVALNDAGFALEGNRFALEGIHGNIVWRNDQHTENSLAFRKMAIGRLESGEFNAAFAIYPAQSFALTSQITIPLLDGELILRRLVAGMSEDETGRNWEGALSLSVTPMALEELTERLDLPIMTGAISADLPLIRYARREASLDGTLIIRVFDGYLSCGNLRLIDPFGVRPRILADVDARHIDLEQLTHTFSFGQITGFVDAGLKGLEIAGWRPVAFNANIVSSPGSYPRRISQHAVNDITSLGAGGGAMAALQASVLRMFSDFGYRRIGLSCRLENGICHMHGIPGSDRGEQYVIVEGGGIPALNIMGFNRRIDWEELLARLEAATQSSGPTFQ